jgi:zinc protease
MTAFSFRLFVLSAVLGGWILGVGLTDAPAARPAVQREQLPNKLVLLLSEDHSLPFVTIQLLLDAGSRRDPAGEEGLAYLTAKGLLLGTTRRPAETFNQTLDFLGASLEVSASADYAVVSLRALKKDLDRAFGLFLEALTRPAFPEEELQKEIKKILGGIQAAEEDPETLAEKAFRQALFGHHPYGHPVEGAKESVRKLTRERVLEFFREWHHPNNAILAVVGDVSLEEVKSRLVPLLTSWEAKEIKPQAFQPTFQPGPETRRIHREVTQASIIIGGPGVERTNPDYYALTVMNHILGGGGLGSRLMEEIRVKRGLAYSVSSFFDSRKYPGSFQVVLQTKNSSAQEALALVFEGLKRIREEPVSPEDLQRAQKYLVGSFPMRFDTQGKLAGFLTQVEYYGRGLDYPEKYPSLIQSVTREDVLRVARTYLHPEQAIRVIVGNLKEAGME